MPSMIANSPTEQLEQILLRYPTIGAPIVEKIEGGERRTWDSGRLLLQIDLGTDAEGQPDIEWYFRDHRTKESDCEAGSSRLEVYLAKIEAERRRDEAVSVAAFAEPGETPSGESEMYIPPLSKREQFMRDLGFGAFKEGVIVTVDDLVVPKERLPDAVARLEKALGRRPDERGHFLLNEERFPLAKKLRRFDFLLIVAAELRPSEEECEIYPGAPKKASRPFPCRAYKSAGNSVYWALNVGANRICTDIAGELAKQIADIAFADEES